MTIEAAFFFLQYRVIVDLKQRQRTPIQPILVNNTQPSRYHFLEYTFFSFETYAHTHPGSPVFFCGGRMEKVIEK